MAERESHTSHKCCAFANCKNRSDNRKDLTFHVFPIEEKQRHSWINKMRREDAQFKQNSTLYCCSEHFLPSDYRKSLTGIRRDLRPGVVPSKFSVIEPPKSSVKISKEREARLNTRREKIAAQRKEDAKRLLKKQEQASRKAEAEDMCINEQGGNDSQSVEELLSRLKLSKFGVDRFKDCDEDIYFYTGLPDYETFMALWHFVQPCADSLVSWKQARSRSDHQLRQVFPYLSDADRQREKSTCKISTIDQLWIFLTRARLGLFERDLAHRFCVSQSTICEIILTWVNYLYIVLGSLPMWVAREDIYIPESFRGQYKKVRGILDCTEIKCEMPKDFQAYSELYSDYKSHDTYKGLTCITPSCWVSFVSYLYPGRISDKELVKESGFCSMIEQGDLYLADKGFEIHELIAAEGASLFVPPKRQSAKDQFTKDECFKTMSIANVRIHIERVIRRVKGWHIFDQVLPLSMHGSVNQLWTVCALLVNFQKPALSV